MPCSAAYSEAIRSVASQVVPWTTTSAPQRSIVARISRLANGRTRYTVVLMPSSCPTYATAEPTLPQDAVTRPRASCSGGRLSAKFRTPRTSAAPAIWRFSSFRCSGIVATFGVEGSQACMIGVRRTYGRSRAWAACTAPSSTVGIGPFDPFGNDRIGAFARPGVVDRLDLGTGALLIQRGAVPSSLGGARDRDRRDDHRTILDRRLRQDREVAEEQAKLATLDLGQAAG